MEAAKIWKAQTKNVRYFTRKKIAETISNVFGIKDERAIRRKLNGLISSGVLEVTPRGNFVNFSAFKR